MRQTRASVRPKPSERSRFLTPNPPVTWVGREQERAWLASRCDAGGVLAIAGWAGAGKSALVRRVLHDDPKRVRRARFVHVAGVGSAASIRRAALAALLGGATAAPDLTDAALLDAAEDAGAILVLDGVDDAALEELGPTLEHFSDFATRSITIVTSRARPPGDLGGRMLWLEALDRDALERLAHELDAFAAPEALADAIARARTPRELADGLANARQRAGRAHPALAGLGDEAIGVVAILHATRRALPVEVFAAAGVDPSLLRSLASRKLAVIDDDHVELRVEAREDLASDPAIACVPEERAAAIAIELGRLGGGLAVEGARLALAAKRAGVAAQLLAAQGESTLGFDDTNELWAVLGQRPERELRSARLRAAALRGDAAALGFLEPPDVDALRDRVEWTRLLLLAGKFDDAAAIARDVEQRALAAGEPSLAFDAQHAQVHALLYRHRTSEALALLDRMTPSTEAQAMKRDSLVAEAVSLGGDHARARKLAAANVGRTAETKEIISTALTLARSGDVLRAEQILDALAPDLERRPWSHPHGNYLLLLRAQIAIERGHAAKARALFRHVEAAYRPGHVSDAAVEIMRVRLALLEGRADGAAARLASLAESLALRPRTQNTHNALAATSEHLSVLTAGAARVEPRYDVPQADESLWAETWRTIRAIALARQAPLDAPRQLCVAAAPSARSRSHPAIEAWTRIASATAELAAGAVGGALEAAIEASEMAARAGYDAIAAEALVVAGEAALIAADEHALESVTDGLESLAAGADAARVRSEATFFRAVRQRSPAALLAPSRTTAALPALRRSAALAGVETRLDAIDVRVVAAIRARFGEALPAGVAPTSDAGADGTEAWAIDVDARSVWLSTGEEVALAGQPVLFAILVALARAGGVASASELAVETWKLGEYHPLRDGNRLRVAVRRLRDRIGHERIETVGDGYRLVGAVRILERRAGR